MSNNPEKISFGPEQQNGQEALKEVGEKRSAELLKERQEQIGEKPRESEDNARHEALERAHTIEAKPLAREHQPSPAEKRNNGPITKAKQEASFKATMKEVRGQMSAPSRTFSKVIHNKAVEKISDTAAATVARPNAILSGAIFAFILTLAVYLIAKNLGYPLSGFETIAAFILGWIIGIIYDFLKVMITGRK